MCTDCSFAGNDELIAVEDSIDVGNVLWIFYNCLCCLIRKLLNDMEVVKVIFEFSQFICVFTPCELTAADEVSFQVNILIWKVINLECST